MNGWGREWFPRWYQVVGKRRGGEKVRTIKGAKISYREGGSVRVGYWRYLAWIKVCEFGVETWLCIFYSGWCASAMILPNVGFSCPVEFMNLSSRVVTFGCDKRYGRSCEKWHSLLCRTGHSLLYCVQSKRKWTDSSAFSSQLGQIGVAAQWMW